MRLVVLVVVAVFAFGACSQEGTGSASRQRPASRQTVELAPEEVPSSAPRAPDEPAPAVTFPPARVLIDTAEGSVIVDAEKAETPDQRSRGLMFRDSLGADEGMVFLFFEATSSAFWMKNVEFPLSIAFFDSDGTILKIMDMEPCEQDPCDVYEPRHEDGRAVTYFGALEVNQGNFDEWGVKEGDRITVTH